MTFKESANTRPLTLACNQCRDCRLTRAHHWAIRCVHEAQLHRENCFITLTYANENLPMYGELQKDHLQKFWKRLRFHTNKKIRYYAAGEYGDQSDRAHYHACLFGIDFADKREIKRQGTNVLYTSNTLANIWGLGNVSLAELNYQTAAYTARYVMKKQLGELGGKYARLDAETGEIVQLQQPFSTMSLRPAIASDWIAKYSGDIYNADKDFIVIRGKKVKPPKYYDLKYQAENPLHMEWLKDQRKLNAEPQTETQLRARAAITHARTKKKTQI